MHCQFRLPLAVLVAVVLLFLCRFGTAAAADGAQPMTEPFAPSGSPPPISLTDGQAAPQTLRITVGVQVTWVNNSGRAIRLSSEPLSVEAAQQLFLPYMAAPGGMGAAGEAQLYADRWTSELIAPGEQFSHTFTQAGEFPYYASHLSGPAGVVSVLDAAARLEITPGALLLTPAQPGGTLAAHAYDAAGNEVFTSITWSSSNSGLISVDANGRVQALAPTGSALIYAHAGALTSSPATVLMAEPAAGVVLIPDAQIKVQPQPVDPNAAPDLGTQVQTVLEGGSPPAVGQILLASEASPLMGKVVNVQNAGGQGTGGAYTVTVETVPLVDVFRNLLISETLDLNQAELVFAEVAAAGADVTRNPDGSIAVHYAGPATPLPSASPDRALFNLGPFECEADADFGLKGSLLDVEFDSHLNPDFLIDINGSKLRRVLVVLEGDFEVTLKGGLEMTVAATGEVTCRMQTIGLRIPLAGPISWFIAPVVPFGAGFDIKGQMNLAQLRFQLDGKVEMELQVGFDYESGSGVTLYKKFNPTSKFGTEFSLPNLLADFGLDGDIYLYGVTGVGVSWLRDLWRSNISWNILDVKAGLDQDFDLLTPLGQATDEFYASSYAADLEGRAGAGPDLSRFFEFLEKIPRLIDLSVETQIRLAESPHGELGATADSVSVGKPLTLTVKLDPTDLQYPALFYNVANVQLYRLSNNQLELVKELPADTPNQADFSWQWTPGDSDVGSHRFVAFVTSKLLPFLPLEIDDDASMIVNVAPPSATLLGHAGGIAPAAAVQGNSLYMALGTRLAIYDVSTPAQPRLAGITESLPQVIEDIVVDRGLAYVADYTAGVYIFDVSNPAAPRQLARFSLFGYVTSFAHRLILDGSTLFVLGSTVGIIDVTDPAQPQWVAECYPPGSSLYGFALDGDTLWVAGSVLTTGQLMVYNVADPRNPQKVVQTTGYEFDGAAVRITQGVVYFSNEAEGLALYDAARPATPTLLGHVGSGRSPSEVAVAGSNMFFTDATDGGLSVYDVSDPAQPQPVADYTNPHWAGGRTLLDGSRLYLVSVYGGVRILDISNPHSVRELGRIVAPFQAVRLAVDGERVFVAGGIWAGSGVRALDATQPPAVVQIGDYKNTTHIAPTDVDLAGNLAIATFDDSFDVVDAANPAELRSLGTLANTNGARESTVAGGYILAATNIGLSVIDISTPATPTLAGGVNVANGLASIRVDGNTAYAYSRDSVYTIDISDKRNPRILGSITGLSSLGNGEHAPPALAGGYVYVLGYDAGNILYVIDVSTPAEPKVAAELRDIGGAPAVAGGLLYMHTDKGVDIYDISTPIAPQLKARNADLPENWRLSPPVVVGSRVYLAHGDAGMYVLEYPAH